MLKQKEDEREGMKGRKEELNRRQEEFEVGRGMKKVRKRGRFEEE